MTLSATNLDLGVKMSVPVKGQGNGVVAVSASVFYNLVSQIPDNSSISVYPKENNLVLETKTTKTIINTQNPKDFPIIPQVDSGVKVKIPARAFLGGLKSVWYSSATSNMKPELSSVYISSSHETMIFAATDSFRLAEKRVLVKNLKDFGYILLPFRNTAEIIRILDDVEDVLEISVSKNQISLSFGEDTVSSRVVEGNFPDYEQILPKESKTEVVVLKQDLINAIKLSNIFANNFNQISFNIDKNKKSLVLNTENQNIGRNSISLDSVIKGDDLSINFNHKYISECFQSITSDSVVLSFNGHHKPMLIKGVGDKSFTYLVMPMNK